MQARNDRFVHAPKRSNKRRLIKQHWPKQEARAYFDELRALLRALRDIVNAALAQNLPALLAEMPRRDEHNDAVTDRVSRMIGDIKITFAERISRERLAEAARKAGNRVSQNQRGQLDKQLTIATGIDPFIVDTNMQEHINAFVSENVSLITSVADKSLADVEQVVLRGARSGMGAEGISSEIQDRFGVAESRANLIARDQTAKLFGEVNELRQRDLGIDSYTWRTSEDERVRPRHASLDGKVFEWSKPPIVDLKTGRRAIPGADFQCRCIGEPLLPE